MNKQRGFLSLAGIIIVVIFGLLSAYLASMAIRSSTSSTYLGSSKQAASIAESGLEQGHANLTVTTNPLASNRATCAGLTGNTSIATGVFSLAKANAADPYFVSTTLSTAIASGATPTTITLPSAVIASTFAPFGRVLIGREVFLYTRISGATLAGVSRAQDGTMASSHLVGAIVSQYQCTLQATGSSPDTVAPYPYGVRIYQQDVQQPMLIGVGLLRANAWNKSNAELAWGDMALTATSNTNGVNAINYHDAWAVGAKDTLGTIDSYHVSRLQGVTWTETTIQTAAVGSNAQRNAKTQDLNAVYATSEQEVWAVGTVASGAVPTNNSRLNILRWNNGTWCIIPTGGGGCGSLVISETGVTVGSASLFAIKTVDTNGDGIADRGFAAGGATTSYGFVMTYNGTTWSLQTTPALPAGTDQLNGLDITPNGASNPIEAFFVGRNEGNSAIVKYRIDSGTMALIGGGTINRIMNAVSVIDTDGDGLADFGCVVGANGTYTFFTSTFTASYQNIGTNANLTGVKVLSSTDIWAVGTLSGDAVSYHYDGTSWSAVTVSNASTSDFTAVSGIFPSNPSSYWVDLIQ